MKASGDYGYPVDRIAGIEAYERVNGGVGAAQVTAAGDVIWESKRICDG